MVPFDKASKGLANELQDKTSWRKKDRRITTEELFAAGLERVRFFTLEVLSRAFKRCMMRRLSPL